MVVFILYLFVRVRNDSEEDQARFYNSDSYLMFTCFGSFVKVYESIFILLIKNFILFILIPILHLQAFLLISIDLKRHFRAVIRHERESDDLLPGPLTEVPKEVFGGGFIVVVRQDVADF